MTVSDRKNVASFMKPTSLKRIGLVALAVFPLYSSFSQDASAPATPSAPLAAPVPNNPPPILTIPKPTGDTAEVVKLTKAGVGEDVILAYVKNSHTYYNLSANDILHLKDQGVSAVVLSAMLTHDHALHTQLPNQLPAQSTYDYNQQSYSSGGQLLPGQTIAQPSQPQPDASAGTAQIATPPLVPTESSDWSQPPPAQYETVPVSPGADYYWYPGYWGWNGGWTWIGGCWFPRGYYGWGWHGGWGGNHGGFWGGSHGSWGGSHGSWSGSHGSWSGSHGGSSGWGRPSGGTGGHGH